MATRAFSTWGSSSTSTGAPVMDEVGHVIQPRHVKQFARIINKKRKKSLSSHEVLRL